MSLSRLTSPTCGDNTSNTVIRLKHTETTRLGFTKHHGLAFDETGWRSYEWTNRPSLTSPPNVDLMVPPVLSSLSPPASTAPCKPPHYWSYYPTCRDTTPKDINLGNVDCEKLFFYSTFWCFLVCLFVSISRLIINKKSSLVEALLMWQCQDNNKTL